MKHKPIRIVDPNYPEVWHAAPDDASPQGYQWLALEQWLALRDAWPRGLPVGVALPNDAEPETIAPDLPRIGLVSLDFPKWTDGRAYSQARLLRVRHRFEGELRATGEVLLDMLPLLERNGFSSAALRPGQDRAAAERALRYFPAHYQADVRGRAPAQWRAAA